MVKERIWLTKLRIVRPILWALIQVAKVEMGLTKIPLVNSENGFKLWFGVRMR